VCRSAAFVVLWFVAGAVATTVAWLGVSTVSEQLAGSGSHPDPLSAEEIAAQRAQGTSTTVPPDGPGATTTTEPTTGPGSTAVEATTSTTGTTATTSPASPNVLRSYELVGGDATLRFSASGVLVVVATPAPGFSVEIDDAHDGGARVEFEGEDHTSRLDAWWDGGPQDEVREEADD
jgi:hypothetical protein